MQIRLARRDDRDAIWHVLLPTIRAGETYALPSDMAPDSDATPATLAAGWNSLLARVINGTRHHALYLRLSDSPDDLLRAHDAAKN